MRQALWAACLIVCLSACTGLRWSERLVRTRAFGPEMGSTTAGGAAFHHTSGHAPEPEAHEAVALAAAGPAEPHLPPALTAPLPADRATGLEHTAPHAPYRTAPVALVPERSTPPLPDRDPDNLMHRPGLQPLAIPSLALVLGGIAMAFLSNSGVLVAGILALGLLLAGISLSRIRSRERGGKVFALIAMVLGTVAALITAMVITRTGF